ncbi:MAG: stage III sporulation protein AE [Oscillospiraceae bacterium]|jgi:stage III sporulation protein AE|nr:stage III sporulation protein AE [Oscillospiraceae bacterium]
MIRLLIEENFGQYELIDALTEEARHFLQESEITPDNAGALGLSPFSVIRGTWDILMHELTRPLRMLAALTGVILLCAVVETLRDGADSGKTGNTGRASDAFGIVGVLAGAGLMIMYISDIIIRAAAALHSGGIFLLTFVPVFAGIMAISGQLTTASVFSVSVITAGQVFTYITSMVLTPLASCILGVSAAGAVTPGLKIEALAQTVQKAVIWTLGLLVAVFTGLLSLQSFVSTSADSVALRAAKFTVSSSVPFVGGAVSDALSAVRGSVNVLRNSTGTFGIIAGIAIIAPALISVFVHKLALSLAAAISAVFGLTQLSSLLKSGESVMSIIFALLFCFVLIVVISVGLMLMIWNGGGG